jgi:hypothetical protein
MPFLNSEQYLAWFRFSEPDTNILLLSQYSKKAPSAAFATATAAWFRTYGLYSRLVTKRTTLITNIAKRLTIVKVYVNMTNCLAQFLPCQ